MKEPNNGTPNIARLLAEADAVMPIYASNNPRAGLVYGGIRNAESDGGPGMWSTRTVRRALTAIERRARKKAGKKGGKP